MGFTPTLFGMPAPAVPEATLVVPEGLVVRLELPQMAAKMPDVCVPWYLRQGSEVGDAWVAGRIRPDLDRPGSMPREYRSTLYQYTMRLP